MHSKRKKEKKTVQVALSKRKKLTMLCHFFKPQLPHMFPASRGLSRRGKNERKERDLCRLPTRFLSRMRWRFLNNQWRFSHVRHNPQNWFARETSAEGAGMLWRILRSVKQCRELHNLANLGKARHLGRPWNQLGLEKTLDAFLCGLDFKGEWCWQAKHDS